MRNEQDLKFKEQLFHDSTLCREIFEICFKRAWDYGHAYGYNEVKGHYEELEEDFVKVYTIGYYDGKYVGSGVK